MAQVVRLAPREKEVCALLLKSLSVKQIAGELGLAFSTVNGYYRSLYRKLEINSKAELFMRFGAESPTDQRTIFGYISGFPPLPYERVD